MMGLWRWANAKSTFWPLTSWKYIIKQRIFLFIRKSLVGQISYKLASQYQYKSGPNSDALANLYRDF